MLDSVDRFAILEQLCRPGAQFLGSRYAIVGGAMSQVSKAGLVAALCEAGGFGVLAAGGRRPSSVEAEILATRALTDRPFGVNVVTLDPRIDQQIQVCVELGVSHIILGGTIPSAAHIAQAKRGGAKVLCFAPSRPVAERVLKLGADALIVEGLEAGGHVGPSTTATLVQELLPLIRRGVLVFVGGGLATGDLMGAYLAMGVAGCQFGTRFLCSHESDAHPAMKAAVIRASARDAVLSAQADPRLKTVPVRALRNAAMADFAARQLELLFMLKKGDISLREANIAIESFWSGRLRRAVVDGDVIHGSLMAGQSAGAVSREESIDDIIQSLVDEAASVLARR